MQDQPSHEDISNVETQRVTTPRDVTAQPTHRLTDQSTKQHSGRRSSILISISVILVVLIVGTTLLVTHGMGGNLTQTFRANATQTPHPTMSPPTPTNVPAITTAQRNAAMGCTKGAPAPYPGLINNGIYPDSTGTPLNEVALTFDDGPTPYSTPTILAFLEKTHTPATFFVEGQFTSLWPDLVRREWNDGFAIGAHTWNHRQLTLLSAGDLQQEFSDTVDAIHQALGKDMCLWLSRPPFGAAKTREITMAANYGLSTINWDDSSGDWLRYGAINIAQTVLAQIRPGGIVLMHDGPAEREQTAEALPLILAGLKERGLKPVTLPQLLQDGHFPGIIVKPLPIAPGGSPPPDDAPQAWVAPTWRGSAA
jgi:peptidoglycan-N-acetylglucosamine deacetylase